MALKSRTAPIGRALDHEIARLEPVMARGWQIIAVIGLVAALGTAATMRGSLGIVAAAFASAFLLWFTWVRQLLLRRAARPLYTRVNLVIEGSIPWIFLALLALSQGPAYAMASWVPPLLFGGVMAVSVLRLSPPVSVAYGVIGAVSYAALYALLLWPALPESLASTPPYNPSVQLVRAASLALGGVLAAVMTAGLRRAVGKAAKAVRARELFGKYRLGRPIAAGGMGTVYQATYCPEGGFERPVAIKRIHPHLAVEERFVEAFRNEAELCARLVHENIVQVLDFGRVGNTYFLAMEYVDGATCRSVMRAARAQARVVSPATAAFVGQRILDGVAYAHAGARDATGKLLRIVHRDLSPANILISTTGQVKVSDFGIAKALRQARASTTGALAGHASSMAPEQVEGKPLDERADLFSAGIIVWELLCGRDLFRRANEAATMMAVLEAQVPAPSTLVALAPDAAAAWDAFFDRALAKDPAARFVDARSMAAALAPLVGADEAACREELSQLLALPTAQEGLDDDDSASGDALDATHNDRPGRADATLVDAPDAAGGRLDALFGDAASDPFADDSGTGDALAGGASGAAAVNRRRSR